MPDQSTKEETALAGHIDVIRQQHDLKIQAIKRQFMELIDATQRPGNGGTITLALLELGTERHLDHFDGQSASDLLQGVLTKVVRQRCGSSH